jgi:hypothetical protein
MVGTAKALAVCWIERCAAIAQLFDVISELPANSSGECVASSNLAERVGFEPTVRFPAHTLSKRAP